MMDTPPIQDNYAFIISTNRVKSEGAYFNPAACYEFYQQPFQVP